MKKCMILFLYLFAVCLWGNIDISTLLEQAELNNYREISSAQLFDVSGNNLNDIIVHGIDNTGSNIIAELTDNSITNLVELNQSVQVFKVFSYESNTYLLTVNRDECKVGELTHHSTFSVNLFDVETSELISTYTHADNHSETQATYYSIKNIIYREDTNLIYLPYIFDVMENDGTAVSQGRTLVLRFDDNMLFYSGNSNFFGNQLLFTEYGNCYGMNIHKNTDYNKGEIVSVNSSIYSVDPVTLDILDTIYEINDELNYAELYTFNNSLLLNTHSRTQKGLLINPETKTVSLELSDTEYNNYRTVNVGGVSKILGFSHSRFCIFDERTSFKLYTGDFPADNAVSDRNNNTILYNWDKDSKVFTSLDLNNPDFLPPFITDTESLAFPVQGISNSESELTFSLFNNTTHTLLISEITAPEGYTLGEGSFQRRAILSDIVVSPDAYTEIHVYFNPAEEGEYNGNISICTDLNGVTSKSIRVAGTCIEGVVTEVSLTENTVWSSENVYVSGDLAINEGVELRIEAGTTVFMAPHSELFVNGRLLVDGTEDAPVVFTSSDDYWNGLRFSGEESVESSIDYCHISNILSIGESNISVENRASLELKNTIIRDNTVYTLEEGRLKRKSAVVYVDDANLTLKSCKVINNSQIGAQSVFSGILVSEDSEITIDNTVITGNTSSDNDMKLYDSQISMINSNLVEQRIYSLNTSIDAVNSIIYSDDFTSPFIINSGCSISFTNCLLNKNAGGYLRSRDDVYTEAIIWDKPEFLEDENQSFRLSGASPCIDSGTNLIDDYSFPYFDIYSNPRIMDGDWDSKEVIDIGVNEYIRSDDNDSISPSAENSLRCYPNPFNPSTHLSFSLENESNVNITIYNIKGQAVRTLVNRRMNSGIHKLEWNGSDNNNKQVSSGVYFCKLSTSEVSKTMKMVLMK